jgi:hypothetical protein
MGAYFYTNENATEKAKMLQWLDPFSKWHQLDAMYA